MTPPRFTAAEAVIVLIDVQAAALSMVGSMTAADLVDNVASLVEIAGHLGMPVLVAEAPFGGPGADRPPRLAQALGSTHAVPHSSNDAWPAIRDGFRATGRTAAIFAGVATDVGVGLAAMSARAEGVAVAVAVDASGTISSRAEQAAWLRLSAAGVALASWTGLAAELAGDYTVPPGSAALKVVRTRLNPLPEEPVQ